ncbi:DUF424 domain-containing protein [Candidatus Micrarchaeota archaeon]|nr:DUF424 domain-containing protein [Candidatus Micrarchaeota archaeon]
MSLVAKIHERRDGHGVKKSVTAVCDRTLLGKVLRQGDAVIDLKTYRGFYEGTAVTAAEAGEMLRQARNINVVGEKAVQAALSALPINKSAVKKIAGVPHVQVYYL